MKALAAILAKLVGSSSMTGALAFMAVAWVVGVGWVLSLVVGPAVCALLLFVGLVAALAFSVLRPSQSNAASLGGEHLRWRRHGVSGDER